MAREKPKAKQNKSNGEDYSRPVAKQDEIRALADFHMFPELPMELRLAIIEEAIHEDQKDRLPQLILFDQNTYRISPLWEQSQEKSPMLFVNSQFRAAALKVWLMLEVLDLGVPHAEQYGTVEDWVNEDGEVEYSDEIAQMIDYEADGSGEVTIAPKGRVYIRPDTDVFLTGLVPRQIFNTAIFSTLLDDDPGERWAAPMCHVTERLPLPACAQISIMHDMLWDPGCPSCGEWHPIHCRECFLEGRGKHLVNPEYDVAVYSNVQKFGVYVMGGDNIPEILMYQMVIAEHATDEFLLNMDETFVVGFPEPKLKQDSVQ